MKKLELYNKTLHEEEQSEAELDVDEISFTETNKSTI